MPPQPTKDDDKLNPGRVNYDQEFNRMAGDLKDVEERGDAYARSKDDDISHLDPDNPAGNIDKKEADPDQAPWKSTYHGGKMAEKGRPLSRANLRAILKKRGPIGLISVVVFGGGLAGLFFGSQALLPVYLVDALTNKFDVQATTSTEASDRLFYSKLFGGNTNGTVGTEGSCKVVYIACRLTVPSNKLLTSMSNAGIDAYDKNGKLITKQGFFSKTRPVTYKFKLRDGTTKEMTAKNYYSLTRSDANVRSMLHAAYNPKFAGYSDPVAESEDAKLGVDKTNKVADANSAKEVANDIDSSSAPPEGEPNGTAGEAAADAESSVKQTITAEATEEVEELASHGAKGGTTGLVAGAVCLVADVPGLVTRTVRTYQIVQLVRYAAVFLSFAGALQAGDTNQTQVAIIGGLLAAGMGAYGIHYLLFGDSKPYGNYTSFVPGYGVNKALGTAAVILDSDAKKQICNAATSPVTAGAIDALTSETIVGPILEQAGGAAGGWALGEIAPQLIEKVIGVIPLSSILGFFAGDLTKNLSGDSVTNAVVAGSSLYMGLIGNGGGLQPTSMADAAGVVQATNQVNLAYAQEDRATHSPLDASTPNTALGALFYSLMPYTEQMSSLSGVLSGIGSIVSGAFGSLLNPSSANAAAVNLAQYSNCSDPSLTGVAAGPFCDILYSIPAQYVAQDPNDVMNELGPGNIDPMSGDPVDGSDYADWVSECTNGDTAHLSDCEISDQTHADYAWWFVYNRANTSMDGVKVDSSGNMTAVD